MSDRPTRLVGNQHWREFAASPEEAMVIVARLDAMTRLPGVPDFQSHGVFRGTQAYFDAMDAEKERKRQLWFQEHTKHSLVK